MSSVTEVCVIGVDLGGTSVRAALFDLEGRQVAETASQPSKAEEGHVATLEALINTCRQVRSGVKVAAIGVAIPGHVDDREGVVRWSPNFGVRKDGTLSYWKDVQIRTRLEESLDAAICLANDANAAALGEYQFGAGGGKARCLVMLTLGTGIGGGVVLGSSSVGCESGRAHMLLGGNLGGAELGHIVVSRGGLDSSSGAYGTVEAYCQRDAIVRRAQNKIVRDRPSRLTDWMSSGEVLTPELVSKAARQGDAVALEVWREVGEYLGTAVGSLINVFAPDVFAIGGQVALAGDALIGPAIEEAERVAIPSLFKDCRIGVAHRIADAGLLGAAAIAIQQVKS